LRGISRKISEGASFSSAFSAYGLHFSPLHCSLIRTGDQSGELAEVFAALARREEEWYVTKHRVYTALTYPALMSVILVLLVLVILPLTVTQMVPMVVGDQPMPWPTRALLEGCQAMLSWPFWLAVALLGVVAARSLSNSALRESLLLRLHSLPVLGRTLKAAACQAFFYALHLQTRAGLNLHSSLRSAADVSGHRVLQESIARQSRRFREGEIELFEVFEAFEPMVSQSVVTLQETGQPDKIFPALAKFYQMQLENTLEKALSLLNPLITVLMGCIIGFVVIATALPIVKMADSL
jgi:type IV pilus assembly protein PilC